MRPKKAPAPLGRLIKRTAALWPELTLARLDADLGDARRLAIGELDACADRFLARWRAAGVGDGARAIVVATPEPLALAAIAGATRAGVVVALASATLDAPSLAAGARAVSAAALAGPANFAGLDLGRRLVEAAAATPKPARVVLWGGTVPARSVSTRNSPPRRPTGRPVPKPAPR